MITENDFISFRNAVTIGLKIQIEVLNKTNLNDFHQYIYENYPEFTDFSKLDNNELTLFFRNAIEQCEKGISHAAKEWKTKKGND